MSSAVTHENRFDVATEGDVEWLRSPGERAAFAVSVVANFAVIGLMIAIVFAGTAWLGSHAVIAKHIGEVRAIVLAAILALPMTSFARHVAFDAARHGGVRVSEQQFPELHAEFARACRKLGFDRAPELYLSLDVKGQAATAYTLLDGRSAVVLNADFIDDDWVDGLDFLTFAVAGALGAIRLGHTRWWVEMLIVYSSRIPGLRTPTRVQWTYSRDRCAAFVVRDGVRGLLLEAVGKHALSSVNVPAFVEQTERRVGIWDRLANIRRKNPSLVARARALYEAGFFDRAHDRERHAFMAPSALSPGR